MSVKCAVCQQAFVNTPGQVCVTCRMRQKSNGGGNNAPASTYSDYAVPEQENKFAEKRRESPVAEPVVRRDYEQREMLQSERSSRNVYRGIVQNVRQTQVKEGLIKKWFQSLVYGVPLSLADEQYVFSLYSQGAYTSERVQGHEVIFYSNNSYSFLSNNSEVKVYGKTDGHGVIIADKILGTNTSFQMRAQVAIPGMVVRVLTVALLLLLILGVVGLGSASVPAVSMGGQSLVLTVIMFAATWLVLKTRMRKRYAIAAVLVCIGLLPISPMFLIILIAGYLVFKIIKV